jgi:aspartokinase
MGPLGLYKPKSIAKERNEFQIVDTPKTARHPVVIGFFAIDHELNRTLLTRKGASYSSRSSIVLDAKGKLPETRVTSR